MSQSPGASAGVRALVAVQPVTARTIPQRRLAALDLPDHLDDLERRIVLRTGIDLARRSPREWARSVRVPTSLHQVRDDVLTDPSDVPAVYDAIPVADEHLRWIEGTSARWGRLPRLPTAPGAGAGLVRGALAGRRQPGVRPTAPSADRQGRRREATAGREGGAYG